MAGKDKSKNRGRRRRKGSSYQPSSTEKLLSGVGQVVATLVERFGWPGAALVLGYAFIVQYASLEQKRRLIDVFVFGDGIKDSYPLIFLGLFYSGLLFAQYVFWSRRDRDKQREIDRLSAWKTQHQSARIDGLHHSDP